MRSRPAVDDDLELPELSPKLKELADSILEEGPASLIAFVHYFMQETQRDPQWMSWLQRASAELGLPDFSAAATSEDLDDGLVYKVKVTLRGVRPAIYRELELPNMTLGDLHEILQTAMGWTGSHLHSFRIGNDYLGPIDSEGFAGDWYDEDSASLSDLVADDKRRLVYEYDFGDGWEHDILIGKPKDPKPGVFYPRCIKGELACPPEDCGGIWGYQELCDTLNTPKAEWDDDQKERMEWLSDYDPQAFSVDEVNQAFQTMYAPPEPVKQKSKAKKKK